MERMIDLFLQKPQFSWEEYILRKRNQRSHPNFSKPTHYFPLDCFFDSPAHKLTEKPGADGRHYSPFFKMSRPQTDPVSKPFFTKSKFTHYFQNIMLSRTSCSGCGRRGERMSAMPSFLQSVLKVFNINLQIMTVQSLINGKSPMDCFCEAVRTWRAGLPEALSTIQVNIYFFSKFPSRM